uniref:Uncharacterized protein n=1 Tax=Panagrolaimus davidi TaxID=227884 RepID=A0A914P0F1_9BILA
MVNSIDLKGGFIIIVIMAFIITLISIFTPAWKVLNNNNQGSNQKTGLVTTDCGGNNQQAEMHQRQGCQQTTDNRQSYEKWTLALLIISAIFQIIGIISALVTLKSGTKIFLNALINVIIALILIIIALIVYGSKINNQQNNNQYYQPRQPQHPPQNYQNYGMNGNYSLGYSFSLSIVAGIFLVFAAIFGIIAAFMSGSGEFPRDTGVIQNHRVQASMAA